MVSSRVSGEGKRPHRQLKDGVSRAIWPVETRYSVVTNRVAQQRRFFIMVLIWLFHLKQRLHIHSFYPITVVATIITCIILLLSLVPLWLLVLLLASVGAITLALLLYRSLHRLQEHISHSWSLHVLENDHKTLVSEVEVKQPVLLEFPATPMPATPLIRVLETIDLSTTNIEHFIDPQPSATVAAEEQPYKTDKNA